MPNAACATYPYPKPMAQGDISKAWDTTTNDVAYSPMQMVDEAWPGSIQETFDEAFDVNDKLRNKLTLSLDDQEIIDRFDSMLADVTGVPESISFMTPVKGINPTFLEPGTILRDPGYLIGDAMSAAEFAKLSKVPGFNDVRVIAPQGTKVARFVDEAGFSQNVLARNTDYRVLGISDDGILNIEVLGNPENLGADNADIFLKNATKAMDSAAGHFEIVGVPAAAQKMIAKKMGLDPSLFKKPDLPTLPGSAPAAAKVADEFVPSPVPATVASSATKPLTTTPGLSPSNPPTPIKAIVDPEVSPKGFVWTTPDGAVYKTKKAAQKHIDKHYPPTPQSTVGVPTPPKFENLPTTMGIHSPPTGAIAADQGTQVVDEFFSRVTPGTAKETLERDIAQRMVPDMAAAREWAARLHIDPTRNNPVRILTKPGGTFTLPEYKYVDLFNATPDEYIAAVRESVYINVRSWINTWATTSGDDHIHALLMQRAAVLEFGLDTTYIDGLIARKFPKGVPDALQNSHFATSRSLNFTEAEYIDQYRPFLRAMYENTQETFRSLGVTHVKVFRGMSVSPSALGVSTFGEYARLVESNLAPIAASAARRGFLESEIAFQPLSSFSTRRNVAAGFANGSWSTQGKIDAWYGGTLANTFANVKIPLMIETEVPVSMVVGMARTGFGCLDEQELVLAAAGGKVKIEVRLPRKNVPIGWNK